MELTVLVDNNTYIDQYYLGEPLFHIILKMKILKYCLTQAIQIYL